MNKHYRKLIYISVCIGLLALFFLSGCTGIQSLNYQGKERQVQEVEEMLSDYLESENPDLDINVSITQDMD